MSSNSRPSSRGDRTLVRAVRVSSDDFPSMPGSVFYNAGAIRGSGTLLDISSTGAHIYMASKILPKGILAELCFLQSGTGRKLRAEAEVVRHTEHGFAVRFLRVERELEQLVLAASEKAEPDE